MLNQGVTSSPLPADTDTEIIYLHAPSSSELLSCPAHLPLLQDGAMLSRATLGSQTHSSDLPQPLLPKAEVKKLKAFLPSSKLFSNFKGKKGNQY